MTSKQQPNVVSVSQLTQAIKNQLNQNFSSVWVEGEISGLTRASSGHVYLTLKDQRAQLNAIIWRSDAQKLKFELANGLKVVCRGGVDVYAQRGTYQLIIRRIQPHGIGPLELAFRQLHAKLEAEGLFEPAHKKALPAIPKHIAVVTSPTGAAVRDFLQVVSRRWPRLRITIVPTKVQGPGSADQIAAAVQACNRCNSPPDVVVVTRGGGSIEDLWSFNEEVVVRAIFDSSVPVISGVGHEIDVTLADLVADVRALTPSEAAERVTPDYREVAGMLEAASQRLAQSAWSRIENARYELQTVASRTVVTQPLERIRQSAIELDYLENSLQQSAKQMLQGLDQQIREMAARLESINPLAVLSRGYSLTTDGQGKPMDTWEAVRPGDKMITRLVDGEIVSTVEQVNEKADRWQPKK